MKRAITLVLALILLLAEGLFVGCTARSTGVASTYEAGTSGASGTSSIGNDKTTFTVTFDTKGGTAIEPQTVNKGEKVQKPQDPQKEGYIAVGWTRQGIDWSFDRTVSSDITLTVKWQPVTYTVTYDANGGTVAAETETFVYDAAYVLSAPERAGYAFAGWYDGDALYQSGAAWRTAADKTLKARWLPLTYSVTYHQLHDGENGEGNPVSFTPDDDTITLTSPTRYGHTFIGWTWEGQNEPQMTATIPAGTHEDQIFTAHWQLTAHSITYHMNGASNAGNNPAIFTGEDAITLNAPERVGYTFTGWTWPGQNEPQTAVTIPAGTEEDLEFTANWRANSYTVILDAQNGTPTTSVQVTFDAAYTLPTPQASENFEFEGWYSNTGLVAQSGTWCIADPVTLTAHWRALEPDDPFQIQDDLPVNLNYANAYGRPTTVNVLTWIDVEKPDFENDEPSEDGRLNAIYERNRAVQNRLGVRLEFDGIRGNSSNTANFVQFVETSRQIGAHDDDIIATYSRTAGALAAKGLLADLNGIENSYLSVGKTGAAAKPWWTKNLNKELSVGSHMYLLAGDIGLTMTDEMHCIYFNKELLDIRLQNEAQAAGVASGSKLLYSYVRDGSWTIDKLVELASGNYVERNHTGQADYGDTFGLCSIDYCATSLYGSAGFRMLEPDGNNLLKLSEDTRSSRLASMAQKLTVLMTSNDYFKGQSNPSVSYVQPFIMGDSLFALQYFEMSEDRLLGNDAVNGYGFVPCPKYDAQQADYLTVVGNAFSVFGIAADHALHGTRQETLSMLSAVLECWAAESYRRCTPALLELYMRGMSSEREDVQKMCEIMRAGLTFDLGRMMVDALGDYRTDNAVIQACQKGANWSAVANGKWNSASATLNTFLANMRKNI